MFHQCTAKLIAIDFTSHATVQARCNLIPYSGKIWRGLQFGDLANRKKIGKLNSRQ